MPLKVSSNHSPLGGAQLTFSQNAKPFYVMLKAKIETTPKLKGERIAPRLAEAIATLQASGIAYSPEMSARDIQQAQFAAKRARLDDDIVMRLEALHIIREIEEFKADLKDAQAAKKQDPKNPDHTDVIADLKEDLKSKKEDYREEIQMRKDEANEHYEDLIEKLAWHREMFKDLKYPKPFSKAPTKKQIKEAITALDNQHAGWLQYETDEEGEINDFLKDESYHAMIQAIHQLFPETNNTYS